MFSFFGVGSQLDLRLSVKCFPGDEVISLSVDLVKKPLFNMHLRVLPFVI